MKFTVKAMDISTGGVLVAVMLQADAQVLDMHHGDRILVKAKRRKTVVILDVAVDGRQLKRGEIGLFEEVLTKLKAKNKDKVTIEYAHKPYSLQYIKKKLEGKALSEQEMDTIVSDIVRDELTDGELTYFVSACYARGMTAQETVFLTKAIVNHGETLTVRKRIVLDKHCIGGVPGNRTTMIVVPIIAAAGLSMPKTSSRSITSAAGTADTMEVLAPVAFPVKKMKRILKQCNAFIVWGGGVNLAAADDKLIRVRHPLSIDPEWMLVASILAKKKAVDATHALIDIPVGPDTKIKTQAEARRLKEAFTRLGRRLGLKISVIITKGDTIIGNGVGPVLEARDVLYVLQRDEKRPRDLERKSLAIAAALLKISGVKKPYEKARELLESGAAYAKMQQIIKAQGGDPGVQPEELKLAQYTASIRAHRSGTIKYINCQTIARMAKIAGAPVDKGAGLYAHKHKGSRVKKGEVLFTLYSDSQAKLRFACKEFSRDDVKIR